MLIVFGWGDDPQVARTIGELDSLGIEVLICDFAGDGRLSLTSCDPDPPEVSVNGYNLTGQELVWDRSKFFPGTLFYFRDTLEGETEHERRRRHAMREAEWRASLRYLSLTGEFEYLNDHAARTRMVKPVQQRIASKLGMKTPPSIVSSDQATVRDFAATHNALITKSLGGHRILFHEQEGRNAEVIMTMACGLQDIVQADRASIEALPHFFQKRIAKAFEVRVFVHAGGAHAFRVDSQSILLTEVDWRHGATFLDFEPCELPENLTRACMRFLQHFNLFYGSFDFIVDPDGAWWFLECNQDGQWIWLDNACDQEITRSFAAAIADRVRSLAGQ